MQDISVFDVIGPVMVGPSSSHTAGAARMAYLAGRLCPEGVAKAEFTLYGSFALTGDGHGTPKALLGGILGLLPEDPNIRRSFELARERGVEFSFAYDAAETDLHPNTADMVLTSKSGRVTRVRGKSVGGGQVVIENINGVHVDFTGNYSTLLVEHRDTPGVVAFITNTLSRKNINIAFMRLYREGRGTRAFTVIEADSPIPQEAARDMEAYGDIVSAVVLEVQSQ